MAKVLKFQEHNEPDLLRLDLGSGKGRKTPDGFVSVDLIRGDGVAVVADLRQRWPWKNSSVDAVHCDYLLQYLTAKERVHFANELYRVLKQGTQATIICPHWSANKAYMDASVQWPPVAEGWFATLSKGWRDAQNYVDQSGLVCDFDYTTGYGVHPMISTRAEEYVFHALGFFKEAAQDLIATLTKR